MPRIVNQEERRRQICDVLLDVVAEAGISAVTIRGIAERSGWSTGVISHYFKNRQDLLLGGLRRAAEVLSEYNTRILNTLEGLQALEPLIEGSIPLDGRRLALCRIFFFFYIESMQDEELRKEVESYLSGWRKSVARAIRGAQAVGDLPDTLDAKHLAADLIGLADGLSMHALLDARIMERIQEQSPVRFWIRRLSTPSTHREENTSIDPSRVDVPITEPAQLT